MVQVNLPPFLKRRSVSMVLCKAFPCLLSKDSIPWDVREDDSDCALSEDVSKDP